MYDGADSRELDANQRILNDWRSRRRCHIDSYCPIYLHHLHTVHNLLQVHPDKEAVELAIVMAFALVHGFATTIRLRPSNRFAEVCFTVLNKVM